MRVIAGKLRSRQLKSSKGLELRPTSDRLRETLFDILGNLVVGSRFIDGFAGTGAVGIEALSRGAAEVTFIEKSGKAADLIRRNLESLGVKTGTRVLPMDVLHGLRILEEELSARRQPVQPASPDVEGEPRTEAAQIILFLDPPYDKAAEYDRVLMFAGSANLLEQGDLVIAEHRRNFRLPEAVESLERVRVASQGDGALSFYRMAKKTPIHHAGTE
ncbi:MAG: 16S rRNA (guanine(966)-N(2))-methyltransferase RsmD [Candidatus Acidiferrum sp.]